MASGIMHIRYGSENIGSKASGAVRELSGIDSALDRIRDKIVDLPERSRSGNNLSKASSFLRKKQQEMECRQDALEVLKTQNDTFMSHVETTEKRLSKDIKHNYKQFHKETGIGKTAVALFFENLGNSAMKIVRWLNPVYVLKSAWDTVTDIAGAIADWYNNGGGKYVVDLIMSAAAAVFAVVAVLTAPLTGPVAIVCAIAASVIAIDAFASMVKSAVTVGNYYSGNEEMAHELHSKSVSEAIFGPDSTASKIYDTIVGVACVIDVTNSIAKAGKGLTKILKEVDGKGLSKFKNVAVRYGKDVWGKNVKSFTNQIRTGGFVKTMKNILTTPIPKVGDSIKGFKKITYDPIKVLMTLPKIGKTFDTSLYKNIRNWRTILKFAM